MKILACTWFLLLFGCSGATEASGEAASVPSVAAAAPVHMDALGKPAGTEVERGDMNGDGKPDVWKYTRQIPDAGAPGAMKAETVRTEADLNFDGRKDVTIEYEPGEIVSREVFDFDYDHYVDQENLYKESKIFEKWIYAPGTNRVFIWKSFEDGLLSQVRQDDSGDGVADRCEEWFKGQRMVKKGRDLDKDGTCDDWKPVR